MEGRTLCVGGVPYPGRVPPTTLAPQQVLRTVFGYDEFRGFQGEVIDHVVGGGDAVVLMPTGGGKSLCHQIPSLVRDGTGIVVSPLIALMHEIDHNGLGALLTPLRHRRPSKARGS